MRYEYLQVIRAYAERIVTAITDKLRPRSKISLSSKGSTLEIFPENEF
jgi:hypothetical protein